MFVRQIQVHDWVKNKAKLSLSTRILVSFRGQELVHMRISEAIHFLRGSTLDRPASSEPGVGQKVCMTYIPMHNEQLGQAYTQCSVDRY